MGMIHCKFPDKYVSFVVIFIIVLFYSPRVRKYNPRKECPITCPSSEADKGWCGENQRFFFLKI